MSITKEKIMTEIRLAEKRIDEQTTMINALTERISKMSVEIAKLKENSLADAIESGTAIMADDYDAMKEILTGA